METKKIKQNAVRNIMAPFYWIQILFAVMVLLSPICWIWFGIEIGWKIFATGILGVFILYIIIQPLKKITKEVTEELIKDKLTKIENDGQQN